MNGRNIGTVILKDTSLKVYQIAIIEASVYRKQKENEEKDITLTLDEIKKDIERRNYIDSHRENSPLRKAKKEPKYLIHLI